MSDIVRLASEHDHEWLVVNDTHLDPQIIKLKIEREECLIVTLDGDPIGWLRWGYFWDQIPFMAMLFVVETERARGYGRQLVIAWEDLMIEMGHRRVMVSTQSDEDAQHFYRKLGYADCGGFILPGEVLEIMLVKFV